MKYLLRYILSLAACLFIVKNGLAQQTLSEAEVINLALKNSAAFQVADLQVKQNKFLQKSAFNLPNPEVLTESPTGEFYTVGVLQSMEFPTVYFKQHQLRKRLTGLSAQQKEITRQDIAALIQQLYLSLQASEALSAQLRIQDSLYDQIYKSAQRQFDAGSIDHLAKTFAQSQAGEIHNQYLQSMRDREVLRNQIMLYAGISEKFNNTPLKRAQEVTLLAVDTSVVQSNPTIQYYTQLQDINRKTLSLERNKALPGIVFGYLNQGAKDSETFYRFRVGFTVPLWFWQYGGNIKAAKTGVKIAEQESRAQYQSLTAEMMKAQGDLEKYNQTLQYYETDGLNLANGIIATATRFFESGENDYINYLRNINEAFAIKIKYVEALRNFNQSVITINYLTGKL